MPYEESVGSYHFDLHGLDQSLVDAINEYPGTAEKYLRQTGNKLKSMAKKASPVGKGEYNGKKTKHLKDRWKGEVKGTSGANLSYELRSTAPHFHLVERGHEQTTPSGKYPANGHGYVQGTHFFERAEKEWEASKDLDKRFNQMVDDIKKKVES